MKTFTLSYTGLITEQDKVTIIIKRCSERALRLLTLINKGAIPEFKHNAEGDYTVTLKPEQILSCNSNIIVCTYE